VAGSVSSTQVMHPFLSANSTEPVVNAISDKNSLVDTEHENELLKKQISQLKEKLGECSLTSQHVQETTPPVKNNA